MRGSPARPDDAIPIAVWPKTASNQLLSVLYPTLAAEGIHVRFDAPPLTDAFLREHAGEIRAFHFHWPESIWRSSVERSRLQRARMIVGIWRFLRLAARLGVPVVTWFHNVHRHEHADWIDAIGMRLFARFSRLVVVHSQSASAEAAAVLKADPARTLVMLLGTEPAVPPSIDARTAIRRELDLSPSRRTLLCFGLIRSYKGVDLAIDAVARLGDDYHLIIVGEVFDPALLASLREQAARLSHIRFIPERVSNQRLADLLEASDAVLLPYRHVTGSGVILSAALANRGVVAADLPYFRETLMPEPDAGELFEPGNAAALRDAIVAFFRMAPERRQAAAARLARLHAWPGVLEPLTAGLRALDAR